MKHLLKDSFGLYDKNGKTINYNENISIYNMIVNYGFEFSDITNKNMLVGKKFISANGAPNKIKITFINKEGYVLIKKDFGNFNNLIFEEDINAAVSDDGVLWKIEMGDTYIKDSFNISLTTTEPSKMTSSELNSFNNIRRFIDKNSKPVCSINNIDNSIKYIIIKLNSGKVLSNINTKIDLSNGRLLKDDSLAISYDIDEIKITNSKGVLIDELNVNVNKTSYLKNTLEEF